MTGAYYARSCGRGIGKWVKIRGVMRKRPPPPSAEARFGRRPKIGDRVEILVAEKPFQKGDRGIDRLLIID